MIVYAAGRSPLIGYIRVRRGELLAPKNCAWSTLSEYWSGFPARLRIDVVQEEELSAYLDELERDFSDIALEIGKHYSMWEQAGQYEAEQRAGREMRDVDLSSPLEL